MFAFICWRLCGQRAKNDTEMFAWFEIIKRKKFLKNSNEEGEKFRLLHNIPNVHLMAGRKFII